MTLQAAALVLSWCAIVLLAFAMSGLLRQLRTLEATLALRRVTVGPALGSPAPALNGTGMPTNALLLFVDADCSSCVSALEEFRSVALFQDGRSFMAVFRGPAHEFSASKVRVVEGAQQAFDEYRIPLTPFAVATSSKGSITHSSAVGSRGAVARFVSLLDRGE